MDDREQALGNYTHPGIALQVRARARAAAGDAALTTTHLALFDEFHMGGRLATERVAQALAPGPGDRVLDVGAGLGGPARWVAETTGAHVIGVDLSPDFVAAAERLTAEVGLQHAVRVLLGDAARVPFGDSSFAHAMMLHVGMNVADKAALFREVARVLVPGGRFAVYDQVLTGDTQPAYPLPWASSPESSYLAPAESYREALESGGFRLLRTEDLSAEVGRLAALQRAGEVPGQQQMSQVLFGDDGWGRFVNLGAALAEGLVVPTLFVAERLDPGVG